MERKLTAILSADVKGYSRLMGEDELATIHTLTAYRELMTTLIQQHRGRVVDSPGDNVLAEFASAVEAVQCAVTIQHELAARNAELPDQRRMEFRIGINVGDVVAEGERLYGDGVNIAARVEGLAEPGGICLAGTAYDQVKTKLALGYAFLGEQRVKNIAEPVRVYRVSEGAADPPARAGVAFSLWRKRMRTVAGMGALAVILIVAGSLLPERFWRAGETPAGQTSLAVLPFRVLTAPEEIGYLSIGIPDAIITQLANVKQMRLRPTSAILRYENQTADPQEVGLVLNTDHVLNGTVQRISDRFRVSVQLVRTSDGVPLWGEHYDVASPDLLGLQDAIARQVTAALKIRMTATERERMARRYTENIEAYRLYLLGRSQQMRYTKEGTRAAMEAFEAALRFDPNYALAHAGLATASAQMRARFVPEAEVKAWEERAKAEARRALELDPHLAEAHEALAAVYRNAEFDWERTIEESTRALELNPNLYLPHLYRAVAFYHLGLPEMADQEVHTAMEINPENRVEPLAIRGSTALYDGRFAEAVSLLEQARELSEALTANLSLAQAYRYAGEQERAEAILAELHGSAQERHAQSAWASMLAARGEHTQAEELLRTVTAGGYLNHHGIYNLGAAYAQLGQHEEALRWLRSAANTGFPCYPWYARDPLLQPLRGDPEFQRFMEELRKSWEGAKARYAS